MTNSVWFQSPSCRCSLTKSHFRHVIYLSLPVQGCPWLHFLGSCGHLQGYSHIINQKCPEKFKLCGDTLSNENRNGSKKKRSFSLSPLRWIVLRYLSYNSWDSFTESSTQSSRTIANCRAPFIVASFSFLVLTLVVPYFWPLGLCSEIIMYAFVLSSALRTIQPKNSDALNGLRKQNFWKELHHLMRTSCC